MATPQDHDGKGDGRLASGPKAVQGHVVEGEQNSQRIESAKAAIEQMACKAILAGHTGAIGIEIPMKDGKLGKLKRIEIVYKDP